MDKAPVFLILPLELISGERQYSDHFDAITAAVTRTAADGKPRALVMFLDETSAAMPASTAAASTQGVGHEP